MCKCTMPIGYDCGALMRRVLETPFVKSSWAKVNIEVMEEVLESGLPELKNVWLTRRLFIIIKSAL